jgi:hypothetical protein
MTRLVTYSTCLVVLLSARLAVAQQEKKEEFQPAKPGPEHAELKKLEGTWDTVMKTPDGKSSKGVATYKMELGGLWLVSDFKGDFDGAPFQGKGLDTYDAGKKKYVSVWVDSMMTMPLVFEGTRDPATKISTSTCECTGPDGKPMKMRSVTKEIDDHHFTFEMYSPGPDGKEAKMMTIEYTRRK